MVIALQQFALSVPDLKVGADFYTTFGLNMQEGKEALGFRCDNRPHDEVVLIETGKDRKFHHISFAISPAGIPDLEQKLKAQNIQIMAPPYPDAGEGLWFHDPDGNLVNVRIADAAVLSPEKQPDINHPGTVNRLNTRGCPAQTIPARPRRFGHMILFSPNVSRQTEFYTSVIGMQLSDTITGNFAAFLRTADSSDHHVLGFLHSTKPGFHHASFEMGNIDETELGAKRLFGKGYQHAWGPGRHGVGSNYFHYFRDPWNGLAEYFHDIDYISKDCDWKADEWTKKDGMFLWSADGPPPEDFGRNYEDT